VTQEKLEEPEPQLNAEHSTSGDKSIKYLCLLEQGSEPKDEIWEDFRRDIYRACLRMETLRHHADDWAQETVIAVINKLPELRDKKINPWSYVWGILRNEIKKAIKETMARRRNISLTPNRTDSLDTSSNESAQEQYTQLWNTNTPDKILESSIESENYEEFEVAYRKPLEGCAMSAISDLPKKQRRLFREYYALKTHDAVKRQTLVGKYDLKSYDNLQVTIHRIWPRVFSLIGKCMSKKGVSLTDLTKSKRGKQLVKNYVKKEIRS